MSGEAKLSVDAATDAFAKDEEPRLWRFEAGENADAWTKGKTYLRALESALPLIEKQLGITVTDPATTDELLAASFTDCAGPGVGFLLMQRRAAFGAKDADYAQLISQAEAATDPKAASDLRTEAGLRADALNAAAVIIEAAG